MEYVVIFNSQILIIIDKIIRKYVCTDRKVVPLELSITPFGKH